MPRTSRKINTAIQAGVEEYLQDRSDEATAAEAAHAEEEALWAGVSRHLLEDAHRWDPDGVEVISGPHLRESLPEWDPYDNLPYEYTVYDVQY